MKRTESCGAHFREEFATDEGEAKRNDARWCSVSAWETRADGKHICHDEALSFSLVPLQQRNYK